MKRTRSYFVTLFTFIMVFAAFAMLGVSASAETAFPYVISVGSTYYECSEDFGSGKRAIVCEENEFVTQPCLGAINGYSYLDENGRSILHDYNELTNNIDIPAAPEGSVALMKHFRTKNHRNGWVDSRYVSPLEPKKLEMNEKRDSTPRKDYNKVQRKEEQTPKEIVEKIRDEMSKEHKSVILVDVSGTMANSQKKVLKLLNQLDFTPNTTIMVFANSYATITKEELKKQKYNVGEDTHLIQALNAAVDTGAEEIILISDLDSFGDVPLNSSGNVKNLTIYNPRYSDLHVVYSSGAERTHEYSSGGTITNTTDQLWGDYFVKEIIHPAWPDVEISYSEIEG